MPIKCIHISRDVIYVLLFEVELNYGSNVDVPSKDGVNQINASITMRQAGQSKKMAEERLSFEERKTILKWYLKFENAVEV